MLHCEIALNLIDCEPRTNKRQHHFHVVNVPPEIETRVENTLVIKNRVRDQESMKENKKKLDKQQQRKNIISFLLERIFQLLLIILPLSVRSPKRMLAHYYEMPLI